MAEFEQELTFTVPLIPQGDEGAAFHCKNSPRQIQRPYILDIENSDLLLQGSLVNVIHGDWLPGGVPATLLICEFQFLGGDKSRHFRKAIITFKFSQPSTRNRGCPEVVSISPIGHFSLNVSRVTEETTHTTNTAAELSVAPPLAGLKLSAGRAWELRQAIEKEDQGSIIGAIRVDGKFSGPCIRNTARWSLTENASKSDGLPSYLRVALLLRLKNNKQFSAEISVKADVDVAYTIKNSIRSFWGQQIDPIIFDPTTDRLGDTPGGVVVDSKNLSQMAGALDNFCAVRATTVVAPITEIKGFATR